MNDQGQASIRPTGKRKNPSSKKRQENASGSARTVSSIPAPRNAREVALVVLHAVRERDAYANLLIDSVLKSANLDQRDRALATELTYGTLRAQGLLDRIIEIAAHRRCSDIDPKVLDRLRLGAYQLLYTRIAPHAAVSTTVDLVKDAGEPKAAPFANAVLRAIARKNKQEWVAQLRSGASDPISKIAIGTAHPEWIARAFAEALGADAGELSSLLDANDGRPQTHLAARPAVATAAEIAATTGGTEGVISPYAVHLPTGEIDAFNVVRQGAAIVQDEGSQAVALVCARAQVRGPDQGRWLDLCAGPGGKSVLLASLLGTEDTTSGGRLTAVEISEHRAELVRQAVAELPVDVVVTDGRESGLKPGFDRVLVDAPCTGLGALRRRPESRWRRSPEDLLALTKIQQELLEAALELVRPGGIVVYSTCSPHLRETIGVVRKALRGRNDFETLDAREGFDRSVNLGQGPYLQLWPHRHGTDAMFACVLRKTTDFEA